MKVVQVQSTIAALKRRRSLKTVYGDSPSTVTVVVRLDTDGGITGWGQTVAPRPGTANRLRPSRPTSTATWLQW